MRVCVRACVHVCACFVHSLPVILYFPIPGPDKWNKLFPIADGDSQSPVDIVTASADYDESLKSHPLTMEYDGEKELVMTNTGHSVASKINQPSSLCLS